MPNFALQVTLRLHPGSAGAFLPLIQSAAAAAVRDEVDCHAFHVAQSEEDPDVFVLFEIYTNAMALEVHHQQPHFLAFGEQAAGLILEKSSQRLTLAS